MKIFSNLHEKNYDTARFFVLECVYLIRYIFNMAAMMSAVKSDKILDTKFDAIDTLYPSVNDSETPLPRSWSPKDKSSSIGLSQSNLRVHYKG